MLEKVLLNICEPLLLDVLRFHQPTEMVLSLYFRQHRNMGRRDRAWVADIIYRVIRHKLVFEASATEGPGSFARRLALLGLPDEESDYLSILTPEEQAWLFAARRQPLSHLPDNVQLNVPLWLWSKWIEQLGEVDAKALALAIQKSPHLDVRTNTQKTNRNALAYTLFAQGLSCAQTHYSPLGLRLVNKPQVQQLEAFLRGEFEIQSEGSQLIALLLGAKREENIVDFCAGAGGKTLLLSHQMRNTGRIYAWDTSHARLDALKPRLMRSGCQNVFPMVIVNEHDERIQRLYGKIDRVLVDAPCSGLGTLRGHPDLMWRYHKASVEALTQQQKTIASAAVKLLRPGGRLVYATCSMLYEENEAVVKHLMENHPDLRLLSCREILDGLKIANAQQITGADGHFLKISPHLHDLDGFFAAALQKDEK